MATSADGPLLLCFDGSDCARQAIAHAGELFPGRAALVATVWQPAAALGTFAWSVTMGPVEELDRMSASAGDETAGEGLAAARDAGFRAESVAVDAKGPVWKTIVELARTHDAAVIVMGSRGLSGAESMLLGSVSSRVLHHADRPVLVIPAQRA